MLTTFANAGTGGGIVLILFSTLYMIYVNDLTKLNY